MHLWPSLRIRDSFKQSYLSKLEFNLHRMKQSKASSSSSSSDRSKSTSTSNNMTDPLLSESDHRSSKFIVLCRDFVLILSCCFCCFCCGACHDKEERLPGK